MNETISNLVSRRSIKKYTDVHVNLHYKNSSERREILGFSGWVTLMSISQRCIFNIAPSVLGFLSGSGYIAIFGIAATLEGYTYTFASALNGMFMPKVSRIVTDNQRDLLPLMIRVGRIQIFIVSLLLLGFVSLGKDFINLWLGISFKEAYYCACLLILPSLLHLPQEIASTAVTVLNKVKYAAYVFVIMAVTNVILMFPFTKLWGVRGMALSICISYFIRTLGMNIIYYKVIHLDLLMFFKESFFKMSIPLLAALVMGLGLQHLDFFVGWPGFILKGVIFIFVYGIIMLLFAMNKSERELIFSSALNFCKKI